MRVLITGVLGTIGSALTTLLRNQGITTVGCDLSHSADETAFSIPSHLVQPRYARADVAEFRQLERVWDRFGPFDYVYHCAAEFGRWNGEDFYETLWKTNAIGTKNVIRLQERYHFRLIHFSSSEVYGDWPHTMVESTMDEYAVHQLNDYAMTKWVNELQIRNSRAQYDTQSVIVRLFNTYGPGERYSPYRSVNCRFLYSALHSLPWIVYRGHRRTSTYLADTVRTLANIIDNFRDGETYNIGGSTLHTIEELSDTVLRVTGAPGSLVEYRQSEVLTTRTKLVDVSKAQRDLDHQNTYSLEEGMALTAEWLRQIYQL
ncbi:MAG: Nucleoside-diphosphate-sugar epimerase [Planctomycetaceae bacterium]|jgi:dTDP-glucose 4,6-dehydratase|nr:Nucleoside-diphosphate-sugar epimerase [Planctomycetaceae bacterium]